MSSLNALIGLPVVSRATAETVGNLIAPVLDVSSRHIVAWQVVKGRHPMVVENAALAGIGQAAAMLDEQGNLRAPGAALSTMWGVTTAEADGIGQIFSPSGFASIWHQLTNSRYATSVADNPG